MLKTISNFIKEIGVVLAGVLTLAAVVLGVTIDEIGLWIQGFIKSESVSEFLLTYKIAIIFGSVAISLLVFTMLLRRKKKPKLIQE